MSNQTSGKGAKVGVALAAALVHGTEEALIVVSGEEVHAVQGGQPLTEEVGFTLSDVLQDPEAYSSRDEVRTLVAVWSDGMSTPEQVRQARFRVCRCLALSIRRAGETPNDLRLLGGCGAAVAGQPGTKFRHEV